MAMEPTTRPEAAASEFFARAVAEQLSQADVFRITITSFLDAYNFDVRRLMKCCIHHVLPSGHVIPFCAYNVLYREGQVVLPGPPRGRRGGRAVGGRPGAFDREGPFEMGPTVPWVYPWIMLASVATAIAAPERGRPSPRA